MNNALIVFAITVTISAGAVAQTSGTASTGKQSKSSTASKRLFIDVHRLQPGKVEFKDVAAAHSKDLAVEKKYGVNFINYWVDEKDGRVVCLSQAPDSSAVINTHKEAHGLIPVSVAPVKQGQ